MDVNSRMENMEMSDEMRRYGGRRKNTNGPTVVAITFIFSKGVY